MKKIVLFTLFILSLINFCSAQSVWTASNNIQSTPYGATDTFDYSNEFIYFDFQYYTNPRPINDSFYSQKLKVNLFVQGDSLYLIDSSKLFIAPFITNTARFYSKQVSADSVLIALDTLTIWENPNIYKDEENYLVSYFGAGPFTFRGHEIKLNLGKASNYNNSYIQYKSISYHIKSTTTNNLQYSPNWSAGKILTDTTITFPVSKFAAKVDNNKILFYHASNAPYNVHNLNTTQIQNDSLYIELYPSRHHYYLIPLSKKSRSTQWYSPRFEVADCNDFSDTLTVGYYYERISPYKRQFFDWITIVKDTANNSISYSPTQLSGDLTFPLPITVLELTVKSGEKSNTLDWITIGEENVGNFEVEKSINGLEYTTIHTTNAIGGNHETHYSYIDQKPDRISYYRIKAIDFDGQKMYSNTVVITKPIETLELSIIPNPTNGLININGLIDEDYRIKVTTLDGKTLSDDLIQPKHNNHQINLSQQAQGVYLISILNLITEEVSTQKILKE